MTLKSGNCTVAGRINVNITPLHYLCSLNRLNKQPTCMTEIVKPRLARTNLSDRELKGTGKLSPYPGYLKCAFP